MQSKFVIHKPALSLQRGAALLLFFLAVLVTGTLLVAGKVALDRGATRYEDNTSEALARAKEALIAYAVSYYDRGQVGRYGILPCVEGPSAASEGSESWNCENVSRYENLLGRLPWKTLDIDALKDGSGECLWYAVSGEYLNSGGTPSLMHNEDSAGMFRLRDENLNIIRGNLPEDRVVAVVIAPGPMLAGQNRQAANPALPCKVARDVVDPADYLEAVGGTDNSDVSNAADSIDDFVTAINLQGDAINDRIITITAGEIFDAIKSQTSFYTRMDNLTEALALCVRQYGVDNMQSAGGGPCDLNQCRTDCFRDFGTCWAQCNTDRDACIAAGGRPNVCNRARNDCRRACFGTWRNCRNACCTGGGGGGNDVYRLPWPAPIDLGAADDRINASYTDRTAAEVADPTGGLLGRLPYNVSNSDAQLVAQGATVAGSADYLTNCTAINVAGVPAAIDFSDASNEYRRLYDHWKDHFFYVVGEAYSPLSTDNTCGNCPTFQGAAANPYAAIVFYSDERTGGQLRRSLQTDPGLETKGVIANYLEGSNSTNNPDATGTGNYNVNPVNDRYCQIDNDPATFTVTCGP